MKKTILILILLILAGLALFLASSGAFYKPTIERSKTESIHLVHVTFIGDYSKTKTPMDKIYSDLEKEGIKTTKGFGIYYDNPQKVKREECRSVVGCILEKEDISKIEMLKKKGFKITELPGSETVKSEFPFKNPVSIILGIMKVYPQLEIYLRENKIDPKPIMELYDVPAKKIVYLLYNGIPDSFFEKLLK